MTEFMLMEDMLPVIEALENWLAMESSERRCMVLLDSEAAVWKSLAMEAVIILKEALDCSCNEDSEENSLPSSENVVSDVELLELESERSESRLEESVELVESVVSREPRLAIKLWSVMLVMAISVSLSAVLC